MADSSLNAVNLGAYISDNLPCPKRLNGGSVNLVCIEPPFGQKNAKAPDPLKPPLSKEEKATRPTGD